MRVQQISSNLFSQLTACTMAPTTTAAPRTGLLHHSERALPAASQPRDNRRLRGTQPLCDFALILSTLSAHSFDFVVPVGKGKPHRVEAKWSVIGSGATSGRARGVMRGPGILTVTQYKVFTTAAACSHSELPPAVGTGRRASPQRRS